MLPNEVIADGILGYVKAGAFIPYSPKQLTGFLLHAERKIDEMKKTNGESGMYFEESEVNGRLCWRFSPKGDWMPYSLKQLTEKYLMLQSAHNLLLNEYEDRP